MKINLFALSGLSVATVCFLLSGFIFFNSKIKLHRIWALFNASVGIFGFGTFLVATSSTYQQAFISWKVTLLGVSIIAMFFYHVVDEFCQLNNKKWIQFVYLHGIFFAILGLTTNYVFHSLRYVFNEFYYYKAGIGFNILFFVWMLIVLKAFINLFLYTKRAKGISLTQGKYLFWGMLLGFLGGATTSFPSWGINIYPAWDVFICVYTAISTYAIFRYQLMDIRIAITRLSLFIFVYSLVLGIPVWIGFKLLGKGLWLLPITFMGIFATIGPFIYLFIQKRAEDRLLQEQRRYQATLRQASSGMGKIKDLKKLLNMIVYVLTHAIQIEHALVYIIEEAKKQYILGASKRKSGQGHFIESFELSSPLIKYFLENKSLIIFEEIKQKALDYKDPKFQQIGQIITTLNGELLVPIFIDQSLIAFIVMGKKDSGKPYTEDDLSVFSILANQTALAIENAKFYEDMKLTQQQLFQAEKMATIGTMADGLSHQINNRFHALGFIAGDALDTIRLSNGEMTPEKFKEVMAELDRAFVRVQENVVQGGEIVQGLLRYTRKGDAGFVPVDMEAVLKSAIEMVQFKIKIKELRIIRDYDIETIPKIKGNFTQLQEVFFNLIDNGYDAMMQRKNEAKEPEFQPTLMIRVIKEDNYAQIIFEDNGMGVKDEDMHKLFTPFFTTKLSSKKGTGLGLYVIRKIVEDNHGGKVEMLSRYMQGTQMKLRLPIAIG